MRSAFRANHINNNMSYKRQKLFTPREHICFSPIVGRVRVAHLFSLLFVVCFSSSCVLCAQCCQCHWIVHFWLPLRFSLTFVVLDLCPVYPMLSVPLDCPFLIAPSVFSNVYLSCDHCCQFLWIVYFLLSLRYSLTFICPVTIVVSSSGLSIFDCPFGIL